MFHPFASITKSDDSTSKSSDYATAPHNSSLSPFSDLGEPLAPARRSSDPSSPLFSRASLASRVLPSLMPPASTMTMGGDTSVAKVRLFMQRRGGGTAVAHREGAGMAVHGGEERQLADANGVFGGVV